MSAIAEQSVRPEVRVKYTKSFSRRMSRGLSPKDKQLFASLMPRFAVTPERIEELDLRAYHAVHFELGFGSGEHISGLAVEKPHELFIGCEPYLNGVSELLADIESYALKNVRINTGDGRVLLEAMPDSSIDTVYVLFADPWPKRRHYKRRVINQELLVLVAAKLKPAGQLVIATDHADYAQWIEKCLLAGPLVSALPAELVYSVTPPSGWVSTRYEAKARQAGREVRYYSFLSESIKIS